MDPHERWDDHSRKLLLTIEQTVDPEKKAYFERLLSWYTVYRFTNWIQAFVGALAAAIAVGVYFNALGMGVVTFAAAICGLYLSGLFLFTFGHRILACLCCCCCTWKPLRFNCSYELYPHEAKAAFIYYGKYIQGDKIVTEEGGDAYGLEETGHHRLIDEEGGSDGDEKKKGKKEEEDEIQEI